MCDGARKTRHDQRQTDSEPATNVTHQTRNEAFPRGVTVGGVTTPAGRAIDGLMMLEDGKLRSTLLRAVMAGRAGALNYAN